MLFVSASERALSIPLVSSSHYFLTVFLLRYKRWWSTLSFLLHRKIDERSRRFCCVDFSIAIPFHGCLTLSLPLSVCVILIGVASWLLGRFLFNQSVSWVGIWVPTKRYFIRFCWDLTELIIVRWDTFHPKEFTWKFERYNPGKMPRLYQNLDFCSMVFGVVFKAVCFHIFWHNSSMLRTNFIFLI